MGRCLRSGQGCDLVIDRRGAQLEAARRIGGEVADGVEELGVLGRVEGRRVARVPPVDLALRVRSRRGRGEQCGSVASGVGERRVREVRSGESGERCEVRPVGGGRGAYAARAERAPAARRAARGAPRS